MDLETGVVEPTTAPELRVLTLFKDRFIGVVAADHPLAHTRVSPKRYAAARHVAVSRDGALGGPIDDALARLGLQRSVAAIVAGFSTAVGLARASDLIATVPERHTGTLRDGMHSFRLPFPTPTFTDSLLWHPRLDADPVHRWLRSHLREICRDGRGNERVEE